MPYDSAKSLVEDNLSEQISLTYKEMSKKGKSKELEEKLEKLYNQREAVIYSDLLPREKCLKVFEPIFSMIMGEEYKYIEVPVLVPIVTDVLYSYLDERKYTLGAYVKKDKEDEIRNYIDSHYNKLHLPKDRYTVSVQSVSERSNRVINLLTDRNFIGTVLFERHRDNLYLIPKINEESSLTINLKDKAYSSAWFPNADLKESFLNLLYSAMFYRINNRTSYIDYKKVYNETLIMSRDILESRNDINNAKIDNYYEQKRKFSNEVPEVDFGPRKVLKKETTLY